MALFLRGNVWWMEYRTRKVRRTLSTGFSREDKAKAQSAYAAFRLAMGAKPKRSAMEGILEAIYGGKTDQAGIPVSGIWNIYEDWCKGKGRVVARATWVNRKNLFARLVKFLEERGCYDISDVSVGVARDFVLSMGKKNKTLRTYCGYISQVWDAVSQMQEGIHNPWKAATPDNDGSSIRKEMFTEEEVARILKRAKEVGHDWHLACMLALYTGMRYGNVVTMQIEDIDFDKWLFTGIHLKTRHSSKAEIFIPVASALRPLLLPLKGKVGFLLPELGVKYACANGGTQHRLEVPFSSILKDVGIEGKQYGFHSFRHTANSRMAEAGVPSEIRQIIFGWTSDAMARHYDHSRKIDQLRDAVEKI